MCQNCTKELCPYEISKNVFSGYTFTCYRPIDESFNLRLADSASYVAWYLRLFLGVTTLMDGDTMTWDIYSHLKSAGALILEIHTCDLYRYNLLKGDIVMFSTNPYFDRIDAYAYWCGVYHDRDHLLNFNGLENFGDRSLMSYVNDPNFDYAYCAVFRIKGSYGVGHPFPDDLSILKPIEPFPKLVKN